MPILEFRRKDIHWATKNMEASKGMVVIRPNTSEVFQGGGSASRIRESVPDVNSLVNRKGPENGGSLGRPVNCKVK